MENRMKRIEPTEITDNFIESIGREWMLVTAGDKESFNTMTASWGGVGYLWNRPVAFVFVRPERYTYGFIERRDAFTLSFLGRENREAYRICGSKSGRDTDKISEAGLTPCVTEAGNIAFEQARLTLECRTLYAEALNERLFVDPEIYPKWYGETHGGDHKMYIAEILNCWIR